jgi:hypothetical protein
MPKIWLRWLKLLVYVTTYFLNNKLLDKILILIILFNSKIKGLIYGQNPKWNCVQPMIPQPNVIILKIMYTIFILFFSSWLLIICWTCSKTLC